MTTYSFSPSRLAFYPNVLRETHYEPLGAWPDDSFDIDDDIADEFMTIHIPAGKMLGVVDDMPAWVDIPPPTQEELIADAEEKKQSLIDHANSYMNEKQWPGKAALGRLKGDDVTQYNLWLDYLDELEAINTQTAPDIEWPLSPGASV